MQDRHQPIVARGFTGPGIARPRWALGTAPAPALGQVDGGAMPSMELTPDGQGGWALDGTTMAPDQILGKLQTTYGGLGTGPNEQGMAGDMVPAGIPDGTQLPIQPTSAGLGGYGPGGPGPNAAEPGGFSGANGNDTGAVFRLPGTDVPLADLMSGQG